MSGHPFATPPYPTPPDTLTPPSPRKRRRILRDSEDTSGELMIETFQYRSDPFRSKTAPHPLPYPLKFSGVDLELFNKVRVRREDVKMILSECGLPVDFDLSVAWLTKPGYSYGDQPRLTVLVQFRGQTSRDFGPAKDALAQYFGSVLASAFDVELIHQHYAFRPSFFPIARTDPAVRIFIEIKQDLVQELQKAIPR